MIEQANSVQAEPTLIVGLYGHGDLDEPDRSLDELASLVEAAGGYVVGRTYQRRPAGRGSATPEVTPATYIGRGKAEEVAALAEDLEAKLVVFDNELSPAQIRELERLLGRKVLDRSELILDIFASRARTREAKLQVELAQLEYTAPRLRGMWTHLERQQAGTSGAGLGLGMRGPGEKQIEIDRRIVKQRIARLRAELNHIHSRKQREVRGRNTKVFTVGLVGYTNAGKSTLMNALTGAGTYAADKLFATLDTKTRRWRIAPGADVALSDTVGFVRKLPHHLVASFRSTLEEALEADLLLHVIDASHPQVLEQVAEVERVLADLGLDLGRIVPVLNKADQVANDDDLMVLRNRLGGAIVISAKTGHGLESLAEQVGRQRRSGWVRIEVDASAGNGKLQAIARSQGQVIDEQFDGDRWIAAIEVPRAALPAMHRAGGDGAAIREAETTNV